MARAERVQNNGGKPGATRAGAKDAPWEAQVAGCRALRIGAHVWVTGANAIRADGRVYGRGDPEAQTTRCLDLIEETLHRVGAAADDVVRVRAFVTDIRWHDVVRAACDARFAEHPPAISIVEVSALVHPAMLVEIEAEAFLPD